MIVIYGRHGKCNWLHWMYVYNYGYVSHSLHTTLVVVTNEAVLRSFCVHKINVSDTSEYIIIYYYKSPHDKYKSNIVRRP